MSCPAGACRYAAHLHVERRATHEVAWISKIETHAAALAAWMAPRHTTRTGARLSAAKLAALIADAREARGRAGYGALRLGHCFG